MTKLKLKSDIFKSFNKSICFIICFIENKERLQKKARERYQNLSKEEKEKKQQYGREHYKNLSEDEKNKLVEYRKKYYRMRKKTLL